MGTVYLAEHELIGRKVAIKSLHSNLTSNEQFILRFRREAKLLASLDHPNIVRLNEYIEHEGRFFLIMEYVAGTELNSYINKVSGAIPENKLIILFSKILDAIAYAHKKGMIHRDLKPSNIIITKDEGVKILDFGIAKLVKENKELTKSGVQVGTVRYMSPEQVRAQKVDKMTDIYTLGVILYQMAVGKAPYNNISAFDTQLKIVNESLPKAQDVYSKVSNKIQSIIDKATQKEKKDRYLNCEDFLEALNSDELIEKSKVKNEKPKKSRFVKNDFKSDNPKNKSKTKLIFTFSFFLVLLIILVWQYSLRSDYVIELDNNGPVTTITDEDRDKVEKREAKEADEKKKQKDVNIQLAQIKSWEKKNPNWEKNYQKIQNELDTKGYKKYLKKYNVECKKCNNCSDDQRKKNCKKFEDKNEQLLVFTKAGVLFVRTNLMGDLEKPKVYNDSLSSVDEDLKKKTVNKYTTVRDLRKSEYWKNKKITNDGARILEKFLESNKKNIKNAGFDYDTKFHMVDNKYLVITLYSRRKPLCTVINLKSAKIVWYGYLKGTPNKKGYWKYCKSKNMILTNHNSNSSTIKNYIFLNNPNKLESGTKSFFKKYGYNYKLSDVEYKGTGNASKFRW